MNDPIDQFLQSDFTGRAPRGLQQAVLIKTTHALRRRRRIHRLAQAGALAACFLAGMGTMVIWQYVDRAEEGMQPIERKEVVLAKQPEQPTAAPDSPLAELRSLTLPARLSPVELEWRAFDSRDNRAALFFAVAKRYFEEEHDYDSALRCYRQALDAARQEELAIRPDDNWLVMALKEARQKENNDAIFNP